MQKKMLGVCYDYNISREVFCLIPFEGSLQKMALYRPILPDIGIGICPKNKVSVGL